ncbi:U4/U6.U5 tri-snRNP-associated protein 2 [Ananas comosus]|uniref:U4/U6.U5 tri-snRNP-associated protein 2 n=1 Tax=Ananas comosus TaxID=4615 RepID=A0A199VET7_ANACO|nr:U4/U6.U5 tri-snRNP-associated protein 2 [Ananas comosus]
MEEAPRKRKPEEESSPEEDESPLASEPKRRRISGDGGGGGGEGAEKGNGGSLLGLADYKDDEDEEEGEEREREPNGRRRGEEEEEEEEEKDRGRADEDDEDEEEEEDDEPRVAPARRQRHVEVRRDCPYLDTVNRQVLDFDFEKFCSISLSNLNVYACLVCGKYYQGRGLKSHAYTHSLEAGHHVYINLETEKVYCLPDGYEINDPSLDDIRHVLNPRFSKEQVLHLDENRQWSRALDGSNYLPGMVGLNNIKETDFVNVTIQSLMRVAPLRNFFLIPENYQHSKAPLVHRFGELTRKIWHARNFKGQVSPHEFLQAVMKASDKRFQIGVQSDPVEFMSWLLNTLHAKLRSSKKKNKSIIHDCFQGELEVIKEIQKRPLPEKKENGEEENNGAVSEGGATNGNVVTEVSRVPFLMLGLDLPPPPLFKDAMEKNIIPQVPLFNILKKFDGETVTEVVRPCIARMRYRNLELKDYIPLPVPKENEKLRSKYDLIANIVHDGKPSEGCYRVFVQRKSEELWYEMQDLHVTETLPQMVALSEAYMQIYEQHE